MIADNRERKLAICKEIVDGKWSNWTDLGDCKGCQQDVYLVTNTEKGTVREHLEGNSANSMERIMKGKS